MRARAAAAWEAAVIADSHHDGVEALRHADRALALYEELDNQRAVGLLRVVTAGLLLRQEQPEPDKAVPLLARAEEDSLKPGTMSTSPMFALSRQELSCWMATRNKPQRRPHRRLRLFPTGTRSNAGGCSFCWDTLPEFRVGAMMLWPHSEPPPTISTKPAPYVKRRRLGGNSAKPSLS